MNSKTKIRIYRSVINEVSKEYENTREFIHNKINELCSEHGISTEEVRLYIFMFVMLGTQFSYVQGLEQIFLCIKIVFVSKSKTYKGLKQHIFC